MVIKPMVRGSICINSHPKGCAKAVNDEIAGVKAAFQGAARPQSAPKTAPQTALILGCSTGYGLASRIAAAFGYGAASIGVSFEKPGTPTKPGTPGWYNNLAVDKAARAEGLPSITLDGDAFSDAMKAQVIEALKTLPNPKIDLVVYSLASPVRTDPKTAVMYRSVIKPIGAPFAGDTLDMMTGEIRAVTAEPATEEEIAATVKVMGGEDWELWIEALLRAGALAENAKTVAYTYIGPALSWPIYKNGTIGRAKDDLERACRAINERFAAQGGKQQAFVSVNKAVVTRASAVIPIIPLYISCLFTVMREQGLHEGCAEQIVRLYKTLLYAPAPPSLDEHGRLRLDDLEMRPEVQEATEALMEKVRKDPALAQKAAAIFRRDFLTAHGFDVEGVDYEADTATDGI